MSEQVNHPSYYGGDVPHEVWKCLEAWNLHLNAYIWTAVKYLARAGKKNPDKYVEDLEKAKWYIDCEIKRVQERISKVEDNPPLRPNPRFRPKLQQRAFKKS